MKYPIGVLNIGTTSQPSRPDVPPRSMDHCRRQSHCRLVFLTCLAVFAAVIGVAVPPAGAATPEQIDTAIKKGVAYIYSQQKPDGRWEKDERREGIAHNWTAMQGDSFGGFSSLSTYALLAAGESPRDKRIMAAVAFLKKADVIGIYSLGLRAQVWHLLADTPKEQAELREVIDADAEKILAGVNTEGENRGLWDYGNGKGKRIDHSVSQYGILGLWALQEVGAKIDRRYWQTFDDVWRAQQLGDGGWGYDITKTHEDKKRTATVSMTAAGIATLFITQDGTWTDPGEHHGNIFNSNIENGLRWITEHFKTVENNYTWYGIERIGVASGTKYFGTTDWFQKGADELIATQGKEGQWKSNGPGTPLTDTCFAVLFLARGRAPVMLNKLQYEIVGKESKEAKPEVANWNERPRDGANLCKWTGQQIETNLNWQLVNLKVAPEDLRDAPILYIAGDQALHFSEAEEQKLATFVHEGGMILGNADFGSPKFASSFMELGTKLFGYEFRPLEPNSPIFREEAHIKESRIKVAALSNGIREMMILFDQGDPGRFWQKPPETGNEEALQLGANIFLYAVDKKNLVSRGQTNVVLPNPKIKNTRTVALARLKYGGNWDPEPGGWQRLAAILHNEFRTDLDVTTVNLSDDKLAAKGKSTFKFAHLTGTTQFSLTDPQIDQIKKFIGSGGTLIIDSGGGSALFTAAAESLLKKLFPEEADQALSSPLTLEDPLYKLAAAPITDVVYRAFASTVLTGHHMPRVVGIRHQGRIAVYFSREDLSAGLVGQPTDGIVGYSPETATAIMRNIILLSLPPVAPLPAKPAEPAEKPARKTRAPKAPK